MTNLESAIGQRTARVGVIGLGYVGLPLIRAFVAAGFRTLGFDVDQRKVDQLQAGQSYIEHIPSAWIAECVAGGQLRADRRHAAAGRGRRAADLRAHAADRQPRPRPDLRRSRRPAPIAAALRPGQLIVLESTTYPGTTRDVVLPILAAERAEGRAATSFWPSAPSARTRAIPTTRASGIPKVVGGIEPTSAAPGRAAVRPGGGAGRAGVELRGGRGLQDPGEHLPRGEHRPGQRAEDALRPDGHRRVGGDRRGQDQAVRLPGVLSRAGAGRALHPDRPVLSDAGWPASTA